MMKWLLFLVLFFGFTILVGQERFKNKGHNYEINPQRNNLIDKLPNGSDVSKEGYAESKKKKRFDLGSQLQKIADVYDKKGRSSANQILKQINGKQDQVDVILGIKEGVLFNEIDLAPLYQLGGIYKAHSRSYIQITLPVSVINNIPEIKNIIEIRMPAARKKFATGFGGVVSESVQLVGAVDFQNSGIDGSGVKVAVIDFGFTGLATTIAAGELPASTVGIDFTGNGIESGNNHGVIVAEHVMDVAPGASLFCFNVQNVVGLENAVDTMVARGIKVATLSVGWYAASYYDDTGPFDKIINKAYDTHGIFITASSGNEADRHWRGVWQDVDGDSLLEFAVGDEDLTFDSTGVVYMNWNQYGAAVTDLDLYIINRLGTVVDSSEAIQNGGPRQSYEIVNFTYNASEAPYRMVIKRYSGSITNLEVTVFLGGGTIVDHPKLGSSQAEPAVAHGTFTVGAVLFMDWNKLDLSIEPFSSRGPTNDGRMKPDIVAPDGTNNFTYSGGLGTSFSTPVVAGAAVLLLAETPTLNAGGITASLRASAIDVGPVGVDSVYGYGKLKITPIVNNVAPILSIINNQSTPENKLFELHVTSTDPNGDSITLSLNSLPTGATFVDSGNGNGLFTWTPSFSQAGSYTLTFKAEDQFINNQEGMVLTVRDTNMVPVITGQKSILTLAEDNSMMLSDTLFNITDLNNPTGPFTLVVQQGSNYSGSGSQFTPRLNYNGILNVFVKVSDGVDTSAAFEVTVTVTPVNDPPQIDSLYPEVLDTVWEGDSTMMGVFASDVDSGEALTYVWTLNGNVVGSNSLQYLHRTTLTSAGSDTVKVRVSDNKSSVTQVWRLVVLNQSIAPQIKAENGRVLTKDSVLKWEVTEDPNLDSSIFYRVELSLDSSFQTILASKDSLLVQSVLLDSLLQEMSLSSGNNLIYWRIKAFDTTGYHTDYTDGENDFNLLSEQATTVKAIFPRRTFAFQNEPNPFRQVTEFQFGVSEGDGRLRVTISIYNMMGGLIKTLVNEEKNPGRYSVFWNSNGYPPGVYFYNVQIGYSIRKTQRMFKVK